MDPFQLFARGVPRIDPGEFPRHVGIVEHLVDRNEPLGRLGMGKFSCRAANTACPSQSPCSSTSATFPWGCNFIASNRGSLLT